MGETLSALVQARMAELGLSQQAAADQIGVTQPTIARWVTGVSMPSDGQIAPLAKWLKRKRADVADLASTGRDSIAVRARQDEKQRRAQAEVPALLRQLVDDVAKIKAHLGIDD